MTAWLNPLLRMDERIILASILAFLLRMKWRRGRQYVITDIMSRRMGLNMTKLEPNPKGNFNSADFVRYRIDKRLVWGFMIVYLPSDKLPAFPHQQTSD